MMEKITNITREGQPPQDGDLIRIERPNGTSEEKHYWAPVEPPEPSRKEVIRARLSEIDRESTKPRTMRELQLNKAATKTWLKELDDEASLLRAELAGL